MTLSCQVASCWTFSTMNLEFPDAQFRASALGGSETDLRRGDRDNSEDTPCGLCDQNMVRSQANFRTTWRGCKAGGWLNNHQLFATAQRQEAWAVSKEMNGKEGWFGKKEQESGSIGKAPLSGPRQEEPKFLLGWIKIPPAVCVV